MWSKISIVAAVIAASLICLSARGQEEFTAADLLQQANDFVAENLDDDAFDALGVDKQRVHEFLVAVQRQFQGTYVYDLATLRNTAVRLQPLLASFEETEPYALWLKSHLDYFEVSQTLRNEMNSRPTNHVALPPPSAETQRRVWVKVIEAKPAAPRTDPQLARLKKIFTEEKVPEELVWIAEVESSFDARARSPAGAAGLFQLMPATARSLDLDVGMLRDERLHPEKSARAAARYLRYLHKRFGDWRLALAAYNCGEGRVSSLLKKHRGKTYDDINQFLPVETQMYTPKIEATLRKREKLRLSDLRLSA